MAFPSAASDGFMHNGSERPAPGEKRRAGNLPVLASSAADKRVTRQRSDSGVSGISTATGPDLGRAFPGLCAGHSSTPTSRARLDVSAAAERAKDAELHSLLESSVTNACDARSNTLGARSPCATGSLTFHSISRHASGGVKCEEELDDHDEELRPEETAQSRGSHKVDSLPQWRQPSGPATELCTPKFGAPAASDSHRLSPTESCAEAPSALRGAAYEVSSAAAWKSISEGCRHCTRLLCSVRMYDECLNSASSVSSAFPPASIACSNAATTKKISSGTSNVKRPCDQEPGGI